MMKIRVLIDRLHFLGHVACSPGYAIDEYKHDTLLADTNSMICESFFSFLVNFKSSIRYMSTERLMLFLQFLVHSWNSQTSERKA